MAMGSTLKRLRRTALIAFALTAAVGAEAAAQAKVVHPRAGAPGTWRLLGTVTANFTADHDAIVVAGPYDYFRHLKFKVTDAPVHVRALVVIYQSGEPERVEVRFEIPKGGESRAIDLRGGERKLRRVELRYDTAAAHHGRADVTMFGMK